jgi:hypothetical protein
MLGNLCVSALPGSGARHGRADSGRGSVPRSVPEQQCSRERKKGDLLDAAITADGKRAHGGRPSPLARAA